MNVGGDMSKLRSWLYEVIGRLPNLAPHDTFLNFGYLENDGDTTSLLDTKENLYRKVVSGIDGKDKRILEIGCGRGGGAWLNYQTLNPQHYLAIDFAVSNIEFCRRHFKNKNLVFEVADAQKLPFVDDSFDVIINVESSHCYQNINAFLSEAHRVLRPGGVFCFCDFRPRNKTKKLRQDLSQYFSIVTYDDITDNVVNALELNTPQIKEAIIKATPGWRSLFRALWYNWAGLSDTFLFKDFKNKRMVYLVVQGRCQVSN